MESGANHLILEASGSVIGAALALVYLEPKSRRDAFVRFVFSVPVGVLFSWVPTMLVDFPDGWKGIVGAALIASFAAWGAAGVVVRLTENYNGNKKS